MIINFYLWRSRWHYSKFWDQKSLSWHSNISDFKKKIWKNSGLPSMFFFFLQKFLLKIFLPIKFVFVKRFSNVCCTHFTINLILNIVKKMFCLTLKKLNYSLKSFSNVKIKTLVHTCKIPVQDFSSSPSSNPWWHLQLYEPMVLQQICSQSPLLLLHSFTSATSQ